MISVKNNFIDIEDFLNIKNFLESNETPWYYQEAMTTNKKDYCFFSHMFFNNFQILSNGFELIKPVLNKIKCKALIHVRANMTINTGEPYESSWHCDYDYSNFKTAIIYINTCNGYTVFEHKKIKSKENTIVMFEGEAKHKMQNQTDSKRRIVINFNYV
jgi:hypothetical protein